MTLALDAVLRHKGGVHFILAADSLRSPLNLISLGGLKILSALILIRLALAEVGVPTPAPATLPEAFAGYRTWHALTAEPQPVPLSLYVMCAHPSQQLIADETRKHGPHAMRYIRVFVNKAARAALAQRSTKAFPPGSVIVKEKLESPSSPAHAGIGVMVKREAGYNPGAGDWQFLYVPAGSVVPNSTASVCSDCHRSKQAEDFVFGSYVH